MTGFPHRTALVEALPKHSVGAEIGVRAANFSRIILNIVKPSRLYLVDCWRAQDVPDDIGRKAHRRTKKVALAQVAPEVAAGIVKVLAMFSRKAARHVPDESLDWVYVDAGHMYHECLDDLRVWYPKVKHGGIITGHDYVENVPYLGVCRAVKDFMAETGVCNLKLTSGRGERAPSFWLEKR